MAAHHSLPLAGLDEIGIGLELRKVSSASRSEDGTPIFAIEGEVANISNAARDVPTMRAIVKAGGKYYTAAKEVKVTVGGCGG